MAAAPFGTADADKESLAVLYVEDAALVFTNSDGPNEMPSDRQILQSLSELRWIN